MYKLGFSNNNCFAGTEKFITRCGVMSFADVVGTEQEVLTREGWKTAQVSCFGRQELWKLVLSDPMTKERVEILTTADHRWLVPRYESITQGEVETKTKDLPTGKMIPRWFMHGGSLEDVSGSVDFKAGVAHGIVYGDGSSYKSATHGALSKAYIDDCKAELRPFIDAIPRCESIKHREARGVKTRRGTSHHGMPGHLKDLPNFDRESTLYLLGFLSGLVATDGSVSKGSVSIAGTKREDLTKISELMTRLGILNSLKAEKTRDTNFKKGAKLSSIVMYSRCFPDWMILREFHKERMNCKSGKEHKPKGFSVVSVEPTGVVEDVFCVTVIDGPAEFTLDKFIGTGNCRACVKGGAGYWNHIRKHFPEEFRKMAELEREIGATCLRLTVNGKKERTYLDELDPEAGRHEPIWVADCGSSGEGCEIDLLRAGS